MRRWMMAILWLTMALPLSAQYNVKKLMEEGRRQLDMGYYVVAMQVFERIAAMKPNLYEAWYLSALCKYRLEDFKGAAEDGSRALALQPYIADIFDLHAMASMRLERYDSAAIDYTRALEIDDGNRDYWFNRAYAIYMGGDSVVASQQLDYILHRWPDFTQAQWLDSMVRRGIRPAPAKAPSMPSKGFWLPSLPKLLEESGRQPKVMRNPLMQGIGQKGK